MRSVIALDMFREKIRKDKDPNYKFSFPTGFSTRDRIKYLKKVLERDTPPNKCYNPVPDGQSGNFKLPIGCVYCNHKVVCWSDSNQGKGLRAFKYAKGLRFLTEVKRLPDVEEISVS